MSLYTILLVMCSIIARACCWTLCIKLCPDRKLKKHLQVRNYGNQSTLANPLSEGHKFYFAEQTTTKYVMKVNKDGKLAMIEYYDILIYFVRPLISIGKGELIPQQSVQNCLWLILFMILFILCFIQLGFWRGRNTNRMEQISKRSY